MMYFVMWARDNEGMLDTRLAVRDEHRARLREHSHPIQVCSGGPWLNDSGEMAGSMLVVKADSLQAVQDYIAQDPYVREGLYQTVEIRPFNWGIGNPEVD